MSGPAALRALVAALVVGLAAAQWLNEPADGTGGGSGGDGNTTGTAASLQLCNSTGGWRSTALAQRPTANDEFRPETADYWRGPVAHAAWPALLGLAAAAALLLLFLLWRCLRCCCACCCCCCCRGQRKGQFKYHTARWLSCLKVLSLVLAAGVAGGAAFGIARVDAGLLGAEGVLDDVQAFLTGIIGEGRGALAAADDMLASLGEVQAALDERVNVTDIGAQLQCLAPLLDALPEPSALAADITAANASVYSTLRPALASLSTQLGSLAERLEPGVGAYVQALETAAGAQVLLFNSPGGIVTQANASRRGLEFAAVAGLLGPSEDPVQLSAAADALAAMLPLTDSLTALVDLRAAVTVVQAAGTTDAYVPTALADLQAVKEVADAVAAIAGTLHTLQDNYTVSQPCLAALLDRAADINATMLLLPDGLDGKVALLQQAQDSLGGLLGDPAYPSAPTSLADQLDSALPLDTVSAALSQLQAADAVRGSIAGLGLQAAADGLLAAKQALQGSEAQLEAALAAAQAYVTVYPSGGGPAAEWAGLVAALQAAASAASAAVGQAPTDASWADQASGLLLVLPELHSAIQQQQGRLDSIASQLDAQLPDVQPYLDSLEGLQGTFGQLPLQPSQLALDAQAEVEALVQGVEQSLDAAKQTIAQKAADVRGYLEDADDQTVGRLSNLRADYMPTVRKYDKIRVAVLYTIFSLACALALLLLLAEIFNYPLGLKVTVALALLVMALCFALVTALTVVLKVGNDGCVNLEDQILLRIPDALSRPEDAAEALAVARYYLFGVGDVDGLLQDAFGFDVEQVQQQINDTRAQLLEDITERFTLQPLLAGPVDRALRRSYTIQERIGALLAAAGRDQVYPVYLSVKQLVCCRTLDMVGNQWLGLILAASCGVAMCGVAMCCLSSLDSLGVKLKGWCACYRRKHFVDEAPFPATSPPPTSKAAATAAAAGGKGTQGSKAKVTLAADARPGSPAEQFIASWHAKQGSLREQYGGSGSNGRESGGAAAAEQGTPGSSPRPSQITAGSLQQAAAAAANRPELLGSHGGSSLSSRPSSPQGRNGGSSIAARDVEQSCVV
ncbi:hypothetical protein COHA_002892 [Chlorella ohadii]|uniref:Uncharacterized protein n=1 Tax=Chlorella ohadii TaxID=2649997 RepID=A0AAD5DVY1_9CHLO|nr:hypothetical protein COHA_002892 [Chlorella ohadii]